MPYILFYSFNLSMKKLELSVNRNGVGAIVANVDLSLTLSPSLILAIQHLLHTHKVVVFRDQALSDAQIEDFAFQFGPPFIPETDSPVLGSKDAAGSIVIVGNQAHEYNKSYLGHQEVLPHSDHQWLRCPSSSSLLYAIDVQENSAPTTWFDMAKAYNELDSQTRAVIENLKIITYNPFYRPFGSVSAKYVDHRLDTPPGKTFPHPLVRTHPVTQEKILFINLAYELEFSGISFEAGRDLFARLQTHVLGADCQYRHEWRKGDLVFWDNRATIHYRPSFDPSVRRVLKRVSIGGEKPF